MQKLLFLFTAEYPYGKGETFLETEIDYLASSFEQIILVVTENVEGKEMRGILDNCQVKALDLSVSNFDKVKAIKFQFSSIYKEEKKIIEEIYSKPFTKGIRNTMLLSLFKGERVKNYISNLKNLDYSTTVFYSYWCNDAALGLALSSAANNGINAISRIHGWDVYFEASAIDYLPYRHFISKHLRGIYAISEDGVNYTKNTWKLPNDSNVKLSRLGVKKQELKSSKSPIRVVSCSNLIKLKRVDLLIEALGLITDLEIQWTHFGDGIEMHVIKSLADELPANISVELIGRVANQEVLDWYRKYSPTLFVNVSSTEGVPVSIMEAISFGIPVLATNVGGNGEIVNEKNGCLIDRNSTSEALSKKLHELLSMSEEEMDSLRNGALSMWNDHYSANTNYVEFVALLKNRDSTS